MIKEVLNDALNNLHAESGALTSSAIVSIDGLPIVSVLERNIDSNRPPALLRQFQSNDFARPAG